MDADRDARTIDRLLNLVRVLPDPADVFGTWLELVTSAGISGKRTHDARIAATLRANGVRHLVTLNDSDFSSFPDVTTINPIAPNSP